MKFEDALLVSMDGEHYTRWDGVQSVNLSEPIDDKWCEIPLKLDDISFTIRFKIKHNRKTFKKYLMSIGMCRDIAEKACQLVGFMGGSLSYEDFFWYIFKEIIDKGVN